PTSINLERAAHKKLHTLHHPWEKGSNENTNGLLRDFFPKGMSIDKISQAEVQKRFNALNFRPRKRLNWKCPAEVFYSVTLHLI
uniref:transposase n=1 Tax=Mesosutterella multiformis TaxID=2259133 RepID=UPI00402A1A18